MGNGKRNKAAVEERKSGKKRDGIKGRVSQDGYFF
jgi:hypothetical protein